MYDEKSQRKAAAAAQELEDALDDRSLSPEERAAIEEQLRNIRKQYRTMVEELYA